MMMRRRQGHRPFLALLVLCGLTVSVIVVVVSYISVFQFSGNPSLKYYLDGGRRAEAMIFKNPSSLHSQMTPTKKNNNVPTNCTNNLIIAKTLTEKTVSGHTATKNITKVKAINHYNGTGTNISTISTKPLYTNNSSIVLDITSTKCNTILCTLTEKVISSKEGEQKTLVFTSNVNNTTATTDIRITEFRNDSVNGPIDRDGGSLSATKTEAVLLASLISTGNASHYLIQTEGCNILDFPPSHPDIIKYTFNHVPELICSKNLPLTETVGLTLIFHENRLADYGSSNASFSCHYQGILRQEQSPSHYNKDCDKKFKLKHKIPITAKETPIEEDAILVTCQDRQKKKPIYTNVHFYIQPRRSKKKREQFQAEAAAAGGDRPEKLSVVIIGTDSVSRGNLKRHMPRTHDYLRDHLHAINLKGLTKIADNTHPNIVALLMGLSMTELKLQKCREGIRRWGSKFDDCPIIWRDFSKKGYTTAYAEDTPHIGSFHHNMHGFVEQPTDYYNRPYYIAAENYTGHSGNIKGAVGYLCQGVHKSISVIHNYSLAIAEELKDIPYFAYYWTTSMTHDFQEAALRADEPCYTYIKKMNERGHLNNTILFFISDHGMRQGKFRSTYAGMLEERLPYANIVFPDWFVKKYPEAINNMKLNTNRLTSTYDLHVTLKDILDQNYKNLNKTTSRHQNGRSLFREIPGKRTCSDAGIPQHYCACESTKEANSMDVHLIEAAKAAIGQLNEGLVAFPNCTQLHLDQVMSGRIGMASKHTEPKMKDTSITSYTVIFSTNPGGAFMEATVRRRKKVYEVSSEISRINIYGNQSHCITDEIYRKYCYCNDLLR